MAGATQTFGTTTIASGLITAQSGNPADILYRTQIVMQKKMLAPTEENLVRQQWAAPPANLARNAGSLTLRFFKRRPAQTTDIITLTEGSPTTLLAAPTEVSVGYVDITLAQIAEYSKISDLRTMVDILNMLDQTVQVMGEDCALKAETVCFTAFVGGLKTWSTALGNNYGFERFAGVTPTGVSSTDWATLKALDAANCRFTRERALGCVTKMRQAKVPAINGQYVAAVPPEVMHDMRLDTTWVQAATQVRPEQLYRRQQYQMDGVDYVETTAYMREASTGAYGTYDSAGDIFAVEFYGRQAIGCPKMDGTSNPWSPQVIILKNPDKSDPAGQFVTCSWKALYNAGLLVVSGTTGNNAFTDYPHAIALRVKSTFA